MYYIRKRMEISAAHQLKLTYQSACERPHGHNWIIDVYCKSKKVDKNGMVIDFTHIKKMVHDRLDHQVINEQLPHMNPTAENIAEWIVRTVPNCYRADVQETEGNIATYMKEEVTNVFN